MRATEPSADDIGLFKPILLAAYKLACRDVLSVRSEIRYERSKMFVVVDCGTGRTRAVRVVYTDVAVPSLVGEQLDGFAGLAAALNLHIVESFRRAQPGEKSDTVVAQRPAAGRVVPFGTTMTVVVTR